MPKPLAVLNIEGSKSDSDLIVRLLKKADYKITFERVETAAQMRAALKKHAWDIVISECGQPQFDGYAALALLQEMGLDIPFIAVSGMIGEETAAAIMKAGAHDYLMKDNLTRLIPAVERELEYAKVRRERKQAEEALRASEKRFRALIENSLDDISLLAADGTLIWESPSVIRNLNYAPNEFLGHNIFELIHPDDLEQNQNLFTELIQKPANRQTGAFRLRRSDGTWRWVEAIATNMLNEPGIQAIVINYRDVTGRKQAENALSASEMRYRSLFEDSPIALWEEDFLAVKQRLETLREQGVTNFQEYFNLHPQAVIECAALIKIVDVNNATLRLFETNKKDNLLKNLAELLKDETIQRFQNELVNITEGKTSFEWEGIIKTVDGRLKNIDFSWQAVPDHENSLSRVVVSMIDITERKQLEASLQESEQRFQLVSWATKDVIWERNLLTNIILWNESLRKIFHFPIGEIDPAVDWWQDHIHPAERVKVTKSIQTALDQGENFWSKEYRFRLSDGSYVNIFDRGYILYNEQGEPVRMIGTMMDITDRKQAEDALLASESSLQGILQSTTDGILAVSLENKVLFANEHFAEMWNIPQEVISSKDDTTLLQYVLDQLTNPQEFLNKVQELYKSQRESFDIFYFKDGRIFERLSKPIMTGKKPAGRVWSFRDVTERKKMEAALLQSEQAHRTLFENVPVGLYRTTADGRILDANPALAKIFGFQDRTSLMKMKAMDLYADPTTDRAFVNEIKGNDSITNLESKFRRRDGTIFYAEDNIHVIRDEHGNPLFYEGSLIDITERKRTEEAARESETRYRSLFEDSPVSLWEEDFSAVKLRLDALRDEGIKDFRAYFASHPQVVLECISLVKIVDVNKAALKLFGAKVKADLLQNLTRFIDNDSGQFFQNELISIAQGKSHFEWEGVNQTLDGRQIVVRLNLSALSGYEDSMAKVIISMIDITTQMHAEKTIRESEKSLRESQMIAGLGSYMLDIPAEKWTSSDILNQIFGIAESYNRSLENWTALIHPDWRQEMSDYFANEVLGNHIRFDKEYKIVRKNDGAERWMHGLGKLEFNAQNQPVKLRGTIQDITERKQAEEMITQQAAEYETMLSTITEGFWLVDEQGRLLDVNDAYCSMSGYSKEELLQFAIQDIEAAESLGETARHIQTIMKAGTDSFESKHRTKNGGVLDVEVSAAFWHERKRFFVFIQDITERKQAEDNLRRRTDELTALQATILDISSPHPLPELLNLIVERAASLLGASSGGLYLTEAEQRKVRCVVSYKTKSDFTGTLLDFGVGVAGTVAETGQPLIIDDYNKWAGRAIVYDERKPFQAVMSAPMLWQGKVSGVIHLLRDDISKKFTQEELNLLLLFANHAAVVVENARLFSLLDQELTERRRAEQQMQALLESMPDGVLVVNAEGNIVIANTQSEALFGYRREEMLGQPIEMLIPERIRLIHPRHRNDYLAAPRIRAMGTSLELSARRQDGSEFPVNISLNTVDTEQGRMSISVIRDITERKQAEESLRTSEQRYRTLFEDMPVSIWEEDFSDVKKYLDSLKEQGVTDLRTYFEHNPGAFLECGTMFKVLDVNQATLKMYHADSRDDLYKNMDDGLSETEVEHIHDALIAISEGKTSHSWEGADKTVTGEPIEVSLNWTVAPDHEADFSKVIVTTMDITARKRAEEALRTSEEKYRLIIENAGEALYVVQNGLIVFVNPMFEKITELPASELIGKPIMEFIPAQEDRMAALKSHLRLLRGKIANTHRELKVRLRSGAERWIDLNEVRTTWEGAVAALTFATDITERKQSEDALQKSEKRFRALIANAGDLIVVINTQGIIQFASPSSERILGYEPEETIGINFTDWIHPHDLSKVLESLASRSRESGVALESIKTRARHKNGSWRILDTIGTSLINEPAIQGIVLNIRDITERELTEETLRASESQFRAIFEGAAIGIALVDASGYPVKENSALQEMLGYDAQELRSMAFTDFTHPDDVMTDWHLWQELIAGLRDHYQIEKRFIHKSGRIIWGKLTASSVAPGADGKILFGVGMVEDITERKLHEREQEALASITQAINQGLDLDVLLQNLLDAALHAIPLAEKGAILLLDAEDTLRIRALSGYLDPRIRMASFPSTSGYSARAVRERQPLIIADARIDTSIRYEHEIEEMKAIQSAIVVPLMVKGIAIGVIALDNASRKGAFNQGELTMLSTFASSAALVIQNSRLLDETRQRIAELELLYESGLAISQLLSPKEIGQKIIDLLEQKMNWHHTAIRLYNAEDETLELLAFHQPDIKSAAERLAMEARFKSMVSRSSQGLSGWVIQHGETVRSGNLINDDRYVETFAGLHSGLYVPIKTGDRIIGVISIESEKENAFSKSDEQLTTILATQAASIFEHARLYEDTIQRATELEQRVTERTTQIEATKRRLELATHAGQIGVWEYNPRENKVIWDERMYIIHQIPTGKFGGTSQDWAQLIHPHDLEKSQLNKQLGFTQNLLLNDEHRILWPDGSVRHIMTSAVMAYSPEGIPERIIGINMDITERKRIEQSLRESETYARLLFDAVPDPVAVTEADGSIVDVNKVFEKQYGLVRGEIRGRRISELGIYPESELDKMDNYLSNILQSQPANPVELEFNAPGDHIHTLELHSYLLKVNDRQLMLNTSHDITEYKKAEEIQRLAKSEMEHALRIKNEFLANMSHELRTPLNSILGISESLEEQIVGALNEKQLKYIGVVRESGRHLLELINDVLDLSKIEAGRMELDIRHISVEKFCQSSLRMIKELAQKKSLNVSYKVNGDVKIILGDERRLKQCLVNLLINAVKFSPPGSRIGLEVNDHSETNEVTFTVWDHGIGIAQKDIQHLFKPFVQLDAGLTREFQGTGLGLALVAQMVHLHGGSISVESEAGKGSRFIITLPWLPSEQTPGAKVTAELSFPSPRSDEKRTGKILLVEDTDLVIQLVSDYLRYKGYEVILAHNGVEGIKLAAQEHPDLILMDVMMPIMDGLEATQKIRTDETLKNTPIVALTALAMSGDSERCLAAGMNDYLSKPIQMQNLADMIEKYLGPAREDKNEQ